MDTHRLTRRQVDVGWDGLFTFGLSLLVLIATLGGYWCLLMVRVCRTAARTSPDAGPDEELWVLGYQLRQDRIHGIYRERLERAACLLRQHPDSGVMLLGGVMPGNQLSEAQAGAAYLEACGIDKGRIRTEDRSKHTLENLREARARMADIGTPVVMVSSRFHLARCLVMAKGLRLNARACAAEKSHRWNLHFIRLAVMEAYLLHWYFIGRGFSTLIRSKHMLGRIS